MEKLWRAVNQIALTPSSQRLAALSPLQLSLIPILSIASSAYAVAAYLRRRLYHFGMFRQSRLPVSVISVGNLTWGGNGKTPMVEFIARWLLGHGVSPLILTRGYGSGDEAKMLRRHFQGTSAKVGVGANRVATASRYKFVNACYNSSAKIPFVDNIRGPDSLSDRIGAVILDDGMQHMCLWRDVEIVMVNAMMPWGNNQLLPLGPLREPLSAFERADMVVIHHANLVAEQDLDAIRSTVRKFKSSLPVYFTRMAPSHFFKADDNACILSLTKAKDMAILCVSAIGFAESFVRTVSQMGPKHVCRLDFSDHHMFQTKDIGIIQTRLKELESEFAAEPLVVVTEKDYDRAPEVLKHLDPYQVLVLCSQLQIVPHGEYTEDHFTNFLKQRLKMWLNTKTK